MKFVINKAEYDSSVLATGSLLKLLKQIDGRFEKIDIESFQDFKKSILSLPEGWATISHDVVEIEIPTTVVVRIFSEQLTMFERVSAMIPCIVAALQGVKNAYDAYCQAIDRLVPSKKD